jgi:hypothetical protein
VSIGRQQLLQRYTRPQRVTKDAQDTLAPFSFKDWIKQYRGLVPEQEYAQYNQYLIDWFKDKVDSNIDSNLQIKLNYLKLLKQLQFFFSKQEIEQWYNNINVNNEKEVLLAIPYFAKKLKEIALYYKGLRENVKNSKIKYNLVGTNTSLNLQLKEFLLKNFTKKDNNSVSIPADTLDKIPELTAVQNTLNIEIEELYDTFQYFDHSPTVPISSFYDTNSVEIENYFNSLGLGLTSTDWVFRTGVFESSGTIEFNFDDIVNTINISEEIARKYIGAEKQIVSSNFSLSTDVDLRNIFIESGNNIFYWPFGAYSENVETLPRYLSTPLSSANLETVGTAGSSINLADIVFTRSKTGIQGAWLKEIPFTVTTPTMQATLEGGKTTKFRYPYPGYGLSGQDIPWTGFDLITNPQFFYLPSNIKKSIEDIYWSTNVNLTSHAPLNINSSTLISNKAFAGRNYSLTDKVRVQNTPAIFTDAVYSGSTEEAWLYKMYQTDISILSGTNTSILWPYQNLNTQQPYPSSVPDDISITCLPIPLSGINFSYATASNSITSADTFYKIQNYQDSIEDGLECAWLSGAEIYYPNTRISAIQQLSLNCTFEPGRYTKFLWQGPPTNCNEVFNFNKHHKSCPYVSILIKTEYTDPQKCTCKQVMFSPFGHNGRLFTDNTSYTDYILEDNNDGSIDIFNWKDSLGNSALSSDNFAWFKTTKNVGWNEGTWITTSNKDGLILQPGKTYSYYRQNTRTKDKQTEPFPKYIVRYLYKNIPLNNFSWIQGQKINNEEWISTNNVSNFILQPGDHLIYSRKPLTTFTVEKSSLTEQTFYENRGSIWSNVDYITTDNNLDIVVTYPLNVFNASEEQYPPINATNLVKITQWTLSQYNLSGGLVSTQNYFDTPILFIRAKTPGLYTLSVVGVSSDGPVQTTFTTQTVTVTGLTNTNAVTANTILQYTTFNSPNTGIFTFNKIPAITAVSTETITFTPTAFNTPLPGYVLNTPLRGWSYNSSTTTDSVIGDIGAKPFWAKGKIDSQTPNFYNENNDNKFVRLVDDFNFITQPEFSDITLNTGIYLEYQRAPNTSITWVQPLLQQITDNRKVWSELSFKNNITTEIPLTRESIQILADPTDKPSSLLLESVIENEPVQVIYDAITPFVWNITAIPSIKTTTVSNLFTETLTLPNQPWKNLLQRHYPNIAVLPTIQNLSSISELGSYFIPTNLGVTQYISKDYTYNISPTAVTLSSVFDNPDYYIGGRGLTKQDQYTPYIVESENSIWLKEPIVAGPIAGTIKKDIFKKYQKFIPYQSTSESKNNSRYGIITTNSRQSPWTGPTSSDWGDAENLPISFTGEINVNAWSDSQILKQTELQLDNWVTDIFGNQYGLYKKIKNVSPPTRKTTGGEIWIRKNSQKVFPGYIGLSGIYDTYDNLPLYHELTGNGITNINTFFDTLFIQTSGVVIFEKIIYEYANDAIFSLEDDARYLSLALPTQKNLFRELENSIAVISTEYVYAKAGETWFFEDKKEVFLSVCGLSGGCIRPEIYRYNLLNLNFEKVFPKQDKDSCLIQDLSSLSLSFIEAPLFTYNKTKKQFTMTVLGRDINKQDTILNFFFNDYVDLNLSDISVYTSVKKDTLLVPPVIPHSLNIAQSFLSGLNFQLSAENEPIKFEGINLPEWCTLTRTGQFIGTVPEPNTYYLPFIVSNTVGPTYYTLTLDALSLPPVVSHSLLVVQPFLTSLTAGLAFNFQITAENPPFIFEGIDLPDWCLLTETGSFVGTIPVPDTYLLPFVVSNSVGSSFYTLTLSAISALP